MSFSFAAIATYILNSDCRIGLVLVWSLCILMLDGDACFVRILTNGIYIFLYHLRTLDKIIY